MKMLFDLSGRLSFALASLAKLLIGAMIIIVIADVVIRNLNLKPLYWGVSVSEYILLYAAFLPMPWLVRIKGHVFVEFLRGLLPPGGRAFLEKIVYAVSVLLCLVLGTIALSSLFAAAGAGEYETRSFDMPKWAVFLPMTLGFYLSALEWARFLMGYDSLYTLDPLEVEGL